MHLRCASWRKSEFDLVQAHFDSRLCRDPECRIQFHVFADQYTVFTNLVGQPVALFSNLIVRVHPSSICKTNCHELREVSPVQQPILNGSGNIRSHSSSAYLSARIFLGISISSMGLNRASFLFKRCRLLPESFLVAVGVGRLPVS